MTGVLVTEMSLARQDLAARLGADVAVLTRRLGQGEAARAEALAAAQQLVSLLSARTFAASGGGFGECRMDTPFTDLRPVIDTDGKLYWRCAHDPEHSVPPAP
jgi:hypothetical protein